MWHQCKPCIVFSPEVVDGAPEVVCVDVGQVEESVHVIGVVGPSDVDADERDGAQVLAQLLPDF